MAARTHPGPLVYPAGNTRAGERSATLPARRRPRGTLYRYLAGEALRPTAFALLGLTAVVLTKDVLSLSDLVINRGFGAGAVSGIALFKALPIASSVFPFAVLVGCLVALGRLGADREILALEACGVAAARLTWPVVSFAGAATAASLLLSLTVSPWAERSLDATLEEMSRRKPWTQFRAGAVSRFGGWQIEAREVSSAGDRLGGVLLWMPDVGETIFAQRAQLDSTADGAIDITLIHGSVLLSSRGEAKELRFERLRTRLPESDEPLLRRERERLRGLPLVDLAVLAREWVPTEDDALPRAALALHRRLAFPAATLIFGLLAVPIFCSRKHFSRSAGGVLGLVCTLAYYGLVQLGEGLVQGGVVGVATGAWLANLLLGAFAALLLLRVRREGVLGRQFGGPRRSAESGGASRAPTHPGRRHPLPRYIAGRYLQLALLSFGVLLVAYLLIDAMERLEWFARHGATGFEILRFYGARVPLLASRVIPMALLVGMALTVSLLGAEGELIGMRSCGIPAPRALFPALVMAAVVAPAYFVLNNAVVARTNALADELKRTEIKDRYYRRLADRRQAGVWYRSGDRVVEASRFDTERGDARELTIYELGDNGLPRSRADARAARHIGRGVWRLVEPARIELADGHLRRVSAPQYADLGEALPAEVDTMHMSVFALAREIEEVEANGYDATAFRVDFHVKLAEALACVVLPAVVLLFAVGGPPFPGPAQTLLVSGILGVGYILTTGVAASLGYGGALPALAAGWAPTLSFSALAGFLGLRVWRRL